MSRRPMAVTKDGGWKWICYVPFCLQSDWSYNHRHAIADGLAHLAQHTRFGIHADQPKRKQ